MVYPNHIKRILAYVIKLLAQAKALKKYNLILFNPINTYKEVYA